MATRIYLGADWTRSGDIFMSILECGLSLPNEEVTK